jgi:hypothetical protein
LSGIDGSRVDLTVTSGNYKVGEVVSQHSNAVTGIIKTIFYYNEILLHPNDNRVTGRFPFQGEKVFQNDTSGARGDIVHCNITSGVIRIRYTAGTFDTVGQLSFSRTDSTLNAPMSVTKLGYTKLRVFKVSGSVSFSTASTLILSTSGEIAAPMNVEPRFPNTNFIYGEVYNISTGEVVKVQSGIHQSNPAKVYSISHGFSANDVVRISGVAGMPSIPWDVEYTVENVTPNTFELQGLDATSSTAYLGGGTIQRDNAFATFDTSLEKEKMVFDVDVEMKSKNIYINNTANNDGTYVHITENHPSSLTLGTTFHDKIFIVDTTNTAELLTANTDVHIQRQLQVNGTVKVRNDVAIDGNAHIGGDTTLLGKVTLQGASDHLVTMKNNARIGLVGEANEALIINRHDGSGPNILALSTVEGNEKATINASLSVTQSTTLGGPIVLSGIITDEITFDSPRKITAKNDVDHALEFETAAIVGLPISNISSFNEQTTRVHVANHGLAQGALITISNSGLSAMDGELFFVDQYIDENTFDLFQVDISNEAIHIINPGAKLYSLSDSNSTFLNITSVEGQTINIETNYVKDVYSGSKIFVYCESKHTFFATVASVNSQVAFTVDETITQCNHSFAQRIDKSIGDDISILDRMEFYGGYVKVHTTKRHAVKEGDTVLLSGIAESDWSNLNGISFIVKETTKTTVVLENNTAVSNMGHANAQSISGGALIRVYIAMLTIDSTDQEESVQVGGSSFIVSGGKIDFTSAHGGTDLRILDNEAAAFDIGSADNPKLISVSTKTADEHVSFTHDLRMEGNGAGKESNLKISTNSNLLIGESATGQFQVDGDTSNTEIDGTV